MTTILELINSFDQKSKEYEDFLKHVITFNADIPFDADEVDSVQSAIITAVNGRLNQAQTRCNGLTILDKILPQCSKVVLLKYCILWLGKSTQVLESVHSSSQDLTLACKIIGNLLIKAKDITEINKQVSMQNVKQIINIVTNLEPRNISSAVYYLIAVLLYHYPEVCERLQVSIRKVILLPVDSNNDGLVLASAKCYALLARATERSFKPPSLKPLYTSWVYNQALLCNALNTIMDELFASLIELQRVEIWDKLELPSVPEDNVIEFYSIYRQRFMNLCCYLSTMLRGLDKKNCVSPQDILQVLCRGLTITPLNLKNRNSLKEQMLYLMLPQLHISLLTVLESLINGCKEQLVPFGSTILQLFQQMLQWTENVMDNQTTVTGKKPFKSVRISIYKCMTSWLMNTSSMSGIETIADDCLVSILKDIVPERDRVLLTIQKTQNLSKRALKKLRDSQYENSAHLTGGTLPKKQMYLDVETCHEALITLQNIFFSAGSWLKPSFFRTTQNIVIPLLYDCYISSDQKFYKDNVACRLQLIRVLRSLQINPHILIPSPTQYSIELFEMALTDIDLLVIHEAKIALAEIEKIIHPIAPSLQLTQIEEVQKEFDPGNQKESTTLLEDMNESNGASENEEVTPSTNKRQRNSDSNCELDPATKKMSTIETTESQSTNTITEKSDSTDNKNDNEDKVESPLIEMTASQESEMMESMDTEKQSEADVEPREIENVIESNDSLSDIADITVDKTPTKADNTSPNDESIDEETILQLFHDEIKETL